LDTLDNHKQIPHIMILVIVDIKYTMYLQVLRETSHMLIVLKIYNVLASS
jgi:hypothetical protein